MLPSGKLLCQHNGFRGLGPPALAAAQSRSDSSDAKPHQIMRKLQEHLDNWLKNLEASDLPGLEFVRACERVKD